MKTRNLVLSLFAAVALAACGEAAGPLDVDRVAPVQSEPSLEPGASFSTDSATARDGGGWQGSGT